MHHSIPGSLAPFFQEYDLEDLEVRTAAPLIIERTLQFGDRSEIHWLFQQYPRTQITDWLIRFANERLPDPHRTFWKTILEIKE